MISSGWITREGKEGALPRIHHAKTPVPSTKKRSQQSAKKKRQKETGTRESSVISIPLVARVPVAQSVLIGRVSSQKWSPHNRSDPSPSFSHPLRPGYQQHRRQGSVRTIPFSPVRAHLLVLGLCFVSSVASFFRCLVVVVVLCCVCASLCTTTNSDKPDHCPPSIFGGHRQLGGATREQAASWSTSYFACARLTLRPTTTSSKRIAQGRVSTQLRLHPND